MKTSSEHPPATQESVWEAFRETDRLIKGLGVKNEESSVKFDREMAELKGRFAETERLFKRSSVEYDRRTKNLEKRMGAWANSHGSFAEEYFFNAFDDGHTTFFGEQFDEIEKNLKSYKPVKDEYDIVFINGKSVGIIETKYKAHENDIPKIVHKAETFKANYPDLANHKIYLGLASMSFYPELEQQCMENGIAIIKQVGDTVVINDEHLKVY